MGCRLGRRRSRPELGDHYRGPPVIPLRDRNPTSRLAFVTLILIAANIAVFLFLQQRSDPNQEARFTLEYAAIPCEIVEGRPLTQDEVVATYQLGEDEACGAGRAGSPALFPDKQVWLAIVFSMFLHGGWLHLASNMWFLWIFGNNVEDRLGWLWYLAFYVAGGVAAMATHVLPQTDSTVPVIGASGAVAAVMGAYLVWYPNAPISTLFWIILPWIFDVSAKWLLAVWFVLQFFTVESAGIAWLAHVGGFVFGVAVGGLVRAARPSPAPPDQWR